MASAPDLDTAIGRAVPEWIGAKPETPVPLRVKLRVFERYGGRCYLSGRRIGAGDKWDVEHRVALTLGGENRERNLAPALVAPHREKTAADVAAKSKAARTRAKFLGVWPKSSLGKHPTLKRTMSGKVVAR